MHERIDHVSVDPSAKAFLLQTDAGLVLTDGSTKIYPDFMRLLPRLKQHNLFHELVVKAAKGKYTREFPLVIDATAGFGEDSFLLAAAGYNVTLCEYNPVIAALLKDALERARQLPELSYAADNMSFHETDSIAFMNALSETPDVILLDPMFPERKKSAQVRKKFQLIHQIERPCENESALLEAAIKAGPKKIIIKRPAKGPFLDGKTPSYSLKGKAVRYDVLVL